MLIAVCVDGGGDRPTPDGEAQVHDAMTQRLEALAKRLAIEQKVTVPALHCEYLVYMIFSLII